MACISVKNLKKSLDGKQVLRGVNLEVNKGEIMAVVGPSGSGKSTLLRCLNRLIEMDGGKVIFEGKDIKSLPTVTLRRKIVLVHQESAMFEGTVSENVSFGPALIGEVDPAHINKCLAEAGLFSEFGKKDASKLSGGEKKRVALARALALRPKVLLLDEPTAGVDPKNIEQVEKTIIAFSKNHRLTVLWVTHHVEQAKRVSTRIANLKEGTVKEVTKTDEFQWEGAY
jgi:ABC-type phosphate transport system ATPase subunit